PAQGARFSTYASWRIKQAIKRDLLTAGQPSNIPAYMVEHIARWKQITHELELRLGRAPTIQELAEIMQLPVKKVMIIRRAVRAVQCATQAPCGDTGDQVSLGELFTDNRYDQRDDTVLREDEGLATRRLLQVIDDREATVLRLRYGLDGQRPLTLKEIGRQIGLTRERVRQIEYQALKKLNARINDDRPIHHTPAEVEVEPPASRRRRRRTGDSSSSIRSKAG